MSSSRPCGIVLPVNGAGAARWCSPPRWIDADRTDSGRDALLRSCSMRGEDPAAARITLRATGSTADGAMSCSVDIGRAIYAAEAHAGVGGAGGAACSGDLLLGALAACAQLTC